MVATDTPDRESKLLVDTHYKITVCNKTDGRSFLQTAVIKMRNPSGNDEKSGRLLLDSGSQRSYITAKAAKIRTDTRSEGYAHDLHLWIFKA